MSTPNNNSRSNGETNENSKKITMTHNILLFLVLLALLAVIFLLLYKDYYFSRHPVEVRYINSTSGIVESVMADEENNKFNYVAVEFVAGTMTPRIEQIFKELNFENQNNEKLDYSLAFPDEKDYGNWYKIKISESQKPEDLITALKKYSEVNFAEAVFME
jgi:hypothetical protein